MRNARRAGVLAIASALAVAGCGDVEETGFIALTQVSGISLEDGGCGQVDDTLVPPLFYDAGVGALDLRPYLVGLWFQNSLASNDDSSGTSIGRTNTNLVQINEIVVEFTDRATWGFLPASVPTGMAFTVPTGEGVGWPVGLLPLDVVSALVQNAESPIREESETNAVALPIRIHAEGTLMDGTAVRSNAFDLTLTVCNRCSGGCPVGAEYDAICSRAQPDLYTCKEAEAPTE